jgi:cation:H+ antiporter
MISSFLFPSYQGFALLLVEFLLAGGLVLALSIRLTHEADQLERLTPLSEMWIGMLLLAFVTSLPEAVNSIGATLMDGALDLGVGNLTGSNMFNVLIIVVLDLVQGSGPILLLVKDSQVFIVAAGILLMALVGGAIASYIPLEGLPTPGVWTGVAFSVAIFIGFLVVSWLLVTRDDGPPAPDEVPDIAVAAPPPAPGSLKRTIIIFAATAVAVVFSSIWLLHICDAMAIRPITLGKSSFTLGHSFVGSFLLALATSLPELFVSLGALKLGRVNMSVANIFGSNIMNMSFIPIMHLVSGQASFYSAISPASIVMLFAAIIMSTLFIVGLLAKSKRSFLFLGWEACTILVIYATTAILVFRMGTGA